MDKKIIAILIVAILLVAGVAAYAVLPKSNSKVIDVDLEIFGNADKDGKIDSADANLVSDYIKAKESNDTDKLSEIEKKISLRFADANNDGTINQEDVDQINDIVKGKASHIWLIDGFGGEKKIRTTNTKIGSEYFANTELCLILGLVDKIVAVDHAPYIYKDFYFSAEKASQVKDMGAMNAPNYDEVNKIGIDILLTFYDKDYDAKADKLYNCDVIFLGCYNPDITNVQKSAFVQGVLKAGYIFGVVDRATDYINWLLDYRDALLKVANSIPEADKPTILAATYGSNYFHATSPNNTVAAYKLADPIGQGIKLGGGHNVVDDINESDITKNGTNSATVNIDTVLGTNTTVKYILLHMVRYTYAGTESMGTPHHGHVYSAADEAASGELQAGLTTMKGKDLVESDMSIYLLAGEFRNGCSAGVLLGAFIGNAINPDAYKSFDPQKMTQEYYDWMGIKGKTPGVDSIYFWPALE